MSWPAQNHAQIKKGKSVLNSRRTVRDMGKGKQREKIDSLLGVDKENADYLQ